MPLSDYVNFNPAPEATGGYNPGGLGVTEDQLKAMGVYNEGPGTQSYYDPQALAALGPANAYSYYNAANTVGITPFEAGQMYQTAFNPQNVYAGSAGVETNPFLGAILQQTSPSTSGLPSNIFQGPLPTIGGAGINALYNLGTAGYNYLTGQGNMPLSSMTGGNLGLSGGDLALSQQGIPSNLSLATGTISPVNPAAYAQQQAANIAANQYLGTPSWAPGGISTEALAASKGLGQQGSTSSTPVTTYDVTTGLPAPESIGMIGGGGQTITGTAGDVMVMSPYDVRGGATSVYGAGPASLGTTANLGLGTQTPSGGIVQSPAVIVPGTQVAQTPTQTTRMGLPVGTGGTTALPEVETKGTTVSTSTTPASIFVPPQTTRMGVSSDKIISLPAVDVTASKGTTSFPAINVSGTVSAVPESTSKAGTAIIPATGTVSATPQTTVSIPATGTVSAVGDVGGGITYNPSAGQVAAGATDRNLARELAQTIPALYGQYNIGGQQGTIMDQYTKMYQGLLGQTAIPGVTKQAQDQLALDAAKLQRIQSGQLAAEDVRNAQQAAREAYGARGQVMGQGAIGAEILNREAIRQQRENEARNAYQASMGNVFNAAQLQTGNIFSPIGQLVSGTFNPLGAYPQDVYSSNVNAQLARDIAAANNAAAIEAAKYGAAAQQKAATTSGIFDFLSKIVPKI